MTSASPWRNSALLAKKAIGRQRRKFIKIPDQPTIATIEHEALSFLDEGDLRAMLTQSYAIILCDYLKGHTAPGDNVLDVGANVGYISAVAASCVGISGQVHGFEPLRERYERLERLRQLNPDFHFVFNNVTLGETPEFLPITFREEER